MDKADLHIHTNASDGTLSPEETVAMAARSSLRAIAITDHDTTDAIAAALAAGQRLGVEVIAGVEISAEYMGDEIHILGYFIDPAAKALENIMSWSVKQRNERNEKMVAALNIGGFDISLRELEEKFPGTVIARPHIARLLTEKGYVKSVKEAFDKYLGQGKSYYIPRSYIPAKDAIGAIISSGGVAVLAHPGIYGYSFSRLREIVGQLCTWGLSGIEAIYTEHSPEQCDMLISLAGDMSIAFTGGSDFHGGNKPDIHMGTGRGNLNIDYKIVENLRSML
jgi:hypothetical protein